MANLKNTQIDDNLELPSGTTAQRPSTPQEGQIRYNTDLETVEFYNGSNWRPLSDTHPEATGGTVVDTDIGGVPYRIHLFTETGTDTLTVTNPGEVEYLIVAGGGGGGAEVGGGGGAGGLLTGTTSVTAQAYTITVGSGGADKNVSNGVGNNGNNSVFSSLTAIGGGGGGAYPSQAGLDGGSGGGGGVNTSGTGGAAGGNGVSGQGNNGGSNPGTTHGSSCGGGGAGSAGEDAGPGGIGILSFITGSSSFYAGGGGGGDGFFGTTDDGPHRGGLGGGGTGANNIPIEATRGVPNTGGGGGGGSGSGGGTPARYGRAGGSGIVIVRYPRNSSLDTEPARTVVATQPQNFQTVRDGLVLELDAGNPVSYPGTGSTWRDLSRIANNGSLENGVSYDSVNGGVLVFDGSNQYVGMGKSYINSGEIGSGDVSYTLEAWFKLQGTPNSGSPLNGMSIIGSASSGGIGFQLETISGDAKVNFGARSNSNYDSNGSINQNEWYHVVCTREVGENNRIYINGELDATLGIADLDVNSTSAEIQIGYANSRIDQYFEGQIAVARLYNTFLTDEQVLQNFNAERHRYGI